MNQIAPDYQAFGQAAPHHQEAEKALLGAIMHRNSVYERVSDTLRPEHFYFAEHAMVYEAMGTLISQGHVADPVTLRHFCEQNDLLQQAGGNKFLAEIAASVITIINAPEYARVIVDMARRRDLIAAAQALSDAAYGAEVDVTADEIMADHEARLTGLGDQGRSARSKGAQTLSSIAHEAASEWQINHSPDRPIAITTGLVDLDRAMGGLFPTDLVILAGRPGMGKTAMLDSIARAAARKFREAGEGSVLIHSLEQDGKQLVTRATAGAAGVRMTDVRGGYLDDHDLKRLMQAGIDINDLPILIDSRAGLTVSQIAVSARRAVRQHKTRLLMVDYLGLIRTSDRYSGNRNNELGEITWALKCLAKELDIAVVLLSQLNRAVEGRENKRPQLADLRESGNIEQDADAVLMLYREDYYLMRDEPVRSSCRDGEDFNDKMGKHIARLDACRNMAEVIIAKQRNGATDTVKVRFDGSRMRFENLSPREQ